MTYSSPTSGNQRLQSPVTEINMPNDPAIDEFYIAENGVRYMWDGVKWIIADDSNLALWRLDASDGTLTPTLSGYGVKVNKQMGERAAALQEEGYDVEILPKLQFLL